MLGFVGCSGPAQEPPAAERRTRGESRAASASAGREASAAAIATISVTITPDKLFLRGRAIEQRQLRAQLEALAERSPTATVAVQADATVADEQMTQLVKTIKAAGFSTVEVATRPVH